MSIVSWFHRFRGVNSFMVSWCLVSWFRLKLRTYNVTVYLSSIHDFTHGFIGFVVPMVSWFHRFRDVNGLLVS